MCLQIPHCIKQTFGVKQTENQLEKQAKFFSQYIMCVRNTLEMRECCLLFTLHLLIQFILMQAYHICIIYSLCVSFFLCDRNRASFLFSPPIHNCRRTKGLFTHRRCRPTLHISVLLNTSAVCVCGVGGLSEYSSLLILLTDLFKDMFEHK